MKIKAVVETAIYVDDLQAAETFNGTILGLRVMGKEPGHHVFFQVGEASILADHAEDFEDAERDEVGEVLALLHDLSQRVSSPSLTVCLEEALADLAHLTACGERSQEEKQVAP